MADSPLVMKLKDLPKAARESEWSVALLRLGAVPHEAVGAVRLDEQRGIDRGRKKRAVEPYRDVGLVALAGLLPGGAGLTAGRGRDRVISALFIRHEREGDGAGDGVEVAGDTSAVGVGEFSDNH